jgi:hypothetical protein
LATGLGVPAPAKPCCCHKIRPRSP